MRQARRDLVVFAVGVLGDVLGLLELLLELHHLVVVDERPRLELLPVTASKWWTRVESRVVLLQCYRNEYCTTELVSCHSN